MSTLAPAFAVPGDRAMQHRLLSICDMFLPPDRDLPKAEISILRSFIFLHLAGPMLGLVVCVALAAFDTGGGNIVQAFTALILMFWAIPIAVKGGAGLDLAALASVQLLVFVCLFGAYHYGGFNSPFAPWFVVAVLLAYLYAPRALGWCLAVIAVQVGLFAAAVEFAGLPQARLSSGSLSLVSAASVLTATFYVSIISLFHTAVRKEGSALAVEARMHDATARKLRQALVEATAANRDKSAFLARISHELRTPLNVVIGYSEMLGEDASLQEKEQRARDLKRITEASRHLLALVNQVIDLAQVEADHLKMDFRLFDVDLFFDRLSDSVEPLVCRNGNRLKLEKKGPLGSIRGDELKLRQCLLNLLSNAGKFTSSGVVTLRAETVRNSLGGSIRFEVQDNGPGIDGRALRTLFAPYRQASPDIFRKFGGSGLGLALTKRFCTLMGGSIEAESSPGQGSLFRIILPIEFDDATEAAAAGTGAGAVSPGPAPTIP